MEANVERVVTRVMEACASGVAGGWDEEEELENERLSLELGHPYCEMGEREGLESQSLICAGICGKVYGASAVLPVLIKALSRFYTVSEGSPTNISSFGQWRALLMLLGSCASSIGVDVMLEYAAGVDVLPTHASNTSSPMEPPLVLRLILATCLPNHPCYPTIPLPEGLRKASMYALLGVLSEHSSGVRGVSGSKLLPWSHAILPTLLHIAGSPWNSTALSSRACAGLEELGSTLPKSVALEFLPQVLATLSTLLSWVPTTTNPSTGVTTNASMLIPPLAYAALPTLSSFAIAAGPAFTPHLEAVIAPLHQIATLNIHPNFIQGSSDSLNVASPPGLLRLRSKAVECLGYVACAVTVVVVEDANDHGTLFSPTLSISGRESVRPSPPYFLVEALSKVSQSSVMWGFVEGAPCEALEASLNFTASCARCTPGEGVPPMMWEFYSDGLLPIFLTRALQCAEGDEVVGELRQARSDGGALESVLQGMSGSLNDHTGEEGGETANSDAESTDDLETPLDFHVQTSAQDLKRCAITALGVVLKNSPLSPHLLSNPNNSGCLLLRIARTLLNLTSDWDSSIREVAITSLQGVVIAAWRISGRSRVGELLEEIYGEILTRVVQIIGSDTCRGVVASACDTVREFAGELGERGVVYHLRIISRALLKVLKGRAPCQLCDDEDEEGGLEVRQGGFYDDRGDTSDEEGGEVEDDGGEEEEEEEEGAMFESDSNQGDSQGYDDLLDTACDALTRVAASAGATNFAPYLKRTLKTLGTLSSHPSTQAMAVGGLTDLLQPPLGPALVSTGALPSVALDAFMNTFCEVLGGPATSQGAAILSECSRSGAFGVGLLVAASPVYFCPVRGEGKAGLERALGLLGGILGLPAPPTPQAGGGVLQEMWGALRDNAIGALARTWCALGSGAAGYGLNSASSLPLILQSLPMREDLSELAPVLRLCMHLLRNRDPFLFSNAPGARGLLRTVFDQCFCYTPVPSDPPSLNCLRAEMMNGLRLIDSLMCFAGGLEAEAWMDVKAGRALQFP